MKAKALSCPPPPPPPVKLSPSEEYKKGIDEISKQLVDIAAKLPLIKQCMKDVKEGYYSTQQMGHIAQNGIVDAVIDHMSGRVVRVEAKTPDKVGVETEVVEQPAHVKSGESEDGNAE